MEDIRFSATLKKLIYYAKFYDLQVAPLTAERLMIAAIDMVSNRTIQAGEEGEKIRRLLTERLIHLEEAGMFLHGYVKSFAGRSFGATFYMQKKLLEAKEKVKAQNAKEMDAYFLLQTILTEPSTPIKAVMQRDTQLDPEALVNDPLISNVTEELENQPAAPWDAPAVEDPFVTDIETPSSEGKKVAYPMSNAENAGRNPKAAKNNMQSLVVAAKKIRDELQARIVGQDHAINVFVSGYFQAQMVSLLNKNVNRPRATFLFAGPPGVGKTALARHAAEVLGMEPKVFDMSEYGDKEAALEFCGSDAVYKDSKQGNFTKHINEHPRSIVILDEIEKAHISIIHLFLQILDGGRIRDSKTDEEISLKETILIFTTNAGKQLYQESEETNLSTLPRKVIINALEKDVNPATGNPYFPSAICSRFASGNVVMFNHLEANSLRRIAEKEIKKNVQSLQTGMGIDVALDEQVYTALLFSEGIKADGRTIRSRAESFFNNELYELMRLVSSGKVKTAVRDIDKIQIKMDDQGMSQEISGLFSPQGKMNVLLLTDEKTVALAKTKNTGCNILGAQSWQAALEQLKQMDVNTILLDVKFGAGMEEDLNIEDVQTPARQILKLLQAQRSSIPIYVMEHRKDPTNEEEKLSYTGQGVRGFLAAPTETMDRFAPQLREILNQIHWQNSMAKLARENKVVTFSTAQTISKNGKSAVVRLFDFKTVVAVEAEDAKSLISPVTRPNVHFDQVIGAQEAKDELTYFVEYLKNPKKYMGTGVKAPRGILLYGPPGTGKTMLAKAMACEAGVSFIAAQGNQFLKRYVGEGPEAVHDLFRTARKYAPSILFVDEIDAIAKERKGDESSGGVEATLTAFLTEMDGFSSDPSKPVFVLAATNFDVEPGTPKSLDPALMRRFDRRVYIDLPNKEDRVRFLREKAAEKKALELSGAQIDNIAMRATGMSLADLDSVVELALRSAIRNGSVKVTDGIFEEAFELFNGGEAKKWDADQLERVARHESGHALMSWLEGQTPAYLTIVARGNHGGYMQHAEQEGKAIYTIDELLGRIRTALGGRAAEIVYYGSRGGVSTGASGDLSTATQLAQQIVCNFGMDEHFGLAVINASTMTSDVRAAVNSILKEQMEQAIALIGANRAKIDALVEALLVKNHLNGTQIDEILSKVQS